MATITPHANAVREGWLEYAHAASGLLFVATNILGWFFVAIHGGGLPDLASGQSVYNSYVRQGMALPTAIFLMTVGFFFALWFIGVLLGKIHSAERAGPLMWIAAGGAFSFVAVFMAGLSLGLGNSLAVLKGNGADVASIYVSHLASLLTGPTTGMCGPAFFVPLAIVIFRDSIFPRWIGWLTWLAALGSITPMLGFWSVSGPLNVGNGVIGVQTIAATWGVYGVIVSVYMLRQIRPIR
jgi:hypothetical protein